MNNTMWLDRRVLVTGATGFVGSYLTDRLQLYGAEVVTIMRDFLPLSPFITSNYHADVTVVRGDLCDKDLVMRVLSDYEIDTVFHLAASTVVTIANADPYSTLRNNFNSTLNILEAMRVYGKVRHAVIASSDKAYGPLLTRSMYKETDPVQGVFPYDCSKSCTDLTAQSYAITYDLPLAVSRCGNIYGGGDMNYNRLVPNTIRRILRGKLPVIHGTGEETRDYFYVEDAVEAYLLLSQMEAQGPYNFAYGEGQTVKQVIETICKEMGVEKRYEIKKNADAQIFYQWLDSSKARTNLGWSPKFSFAEGIRRTVAWYRNRLAQDNEKL